MGAAAVACACIGADTNRIRPAFAEACEPGSAERLGTEVASQVLSSRCGLREGRPHQGMHIVYSGIMDEASVVTEPFPGGSASGMPRRRQYIVLVAVGLGILIAVVGFGGFMVGQVSARRAYANAHRPTEIAVFLCSATEAAISASCKGVTIADHQKSDVRNVLRQLAGDSHVRFVSQQEAYGQFRNRFPDMTRERAETGITAEDLPESFVLPYAGSASLAEVKDAVSGMPGVEAVVARRPNGISCPIK